MARAHSTMELQAVIKAFTKGKSKKEKENAKALERQFHELLQSTRQSFDATVSACTTRTCVPSPRSSQK